MNKERKVLLLSATKVEHGQNELFGNEIHITGIGKVNAAVNTAYLINKYDPDLVVNFGSCGSINESLPEGVMKVGKVINDLDCLSLCDDRDIVLQGKGTINCITTDRFFIKKQYETYSNTLSTRFDEIDIIDMELYGIAKACQMANKLLYSFKWVSDDGDIDKWEEMPTKGLMNLKRYTKNIFQILSVDITG